MPQKDLSHIIDPKCPRWERVKVQLPETEDFEFMARMHVKTCKICTRYIDTLERSTDETRR